MEKILKTLDALKMPTLPSFDNNVPGSINSAVVAAGDAVKTKKKERIGHCITVTDAVCSSSTQSLSDYPKILEGVTEVLFQLCNDPDSDIRLVATDCLHRIVRTVKDQYQHRFQMEIYKEIKKNQSPRSLRIALKLFAFMSPLIRPQKSRVFMASLLPCFTQIAKRTEESLYEYLAPAMCEIFKNLGPFINDNEVKILCRDFMVNLESTSAIIRRSSASILVDLCQYSRKPHVFLPKLLSQLIELLIPNLMEKSVPTLIGVLLCIRQCVEPLSEQLKHNFEKKSPDLENVVFNLVRVYEMCMLLCNHDDHNVVTTALDALQQLFSFPVERLIQRLISPTGIQNSLNQTKFSVGSSESIQISSSRCSLAFSDTTNMMDGDSDVPTFRNFISSTSSEVKEDIDLRLSSLPGSRRNSDVFVADRAAEYEGDSNTECLQSDDENRVRPYSLALHNFPEIQIGSLYECNVPLHYCARFLCYNFLLAGCIGHQRSDKEVRISVKVLAMNCLMNVLNICPEIYFLPLSCNNQELEPQKIEDIVLYLKHTDPLLRGSTYILLGNLITSLLKGENNNFKIVLELVPLLAEGVLDSSPLFETSNIGIKCAITALGKCITPLFRSLFNKELSTVDKIVDVLLATSANPYWLVKVDIIELLAAIEWEYVSNTSFREQEVLTVFSSLLSDEDPRVRSSASNALVKFVSMGNLEGGKEFKSVVLCENCVLSQLSHPAYSICDCSELRGSIEYRLELVLGMLRNRIGKIEDKNVVVGTYLALAALSEKFPPRMYEVLWYCENANEIPLLFHTILDMLRSSPVIHDALMHQNMLTLACNLFLGIISNAALKKDSKTEGNVFAHPSSHVCATGVLIIHHCVSILKIYQGVVEANSSTQSQVKKAATSPTVSPVKKLTQKLDVDKKDPSDSEPERKLKNLVYVVPSCPAHMKKIREALSQNWKIFKSNLDISVASKFIALMESTFTTLAKIFEHIQADFTGLATLIDEILAVSASVFHFCPNAILGCVQQMLRCLFKLRESSNKGLEMKLHGLHDLARANSVQEFIHFSSSFPKTLMNDRRGTAVKSQAEKSVLSGFIRQFEPVVVTALRVYTTSSNVTIQSDVLRLLSCLIKGHVNYGLVDKSQVFLGFVIKQIGFLEEGHIRNNGQLVEEMFEFLTLLTHEQHHQSAKFIDIPKVLRLCDGLVASGQNPITHSIPALKKLVYDLFIERSPTSPTSTNAERKEIEAQREVLLQMLVKLAFVPEALPVIWMILEGRQGTNETKWREDSKLVISVLLPLIENGDLMIIEKHHFCTLAALLFSISTDAIPLQETLKTTLLEAVKLSEHIKPWDFMTWQLHITCAWLLMVKSSIADAISPDFIIEILRIHLRVLSNVLHSPCFLNQREFAVYVGDVFLEAVIFYVRSVRKVSECSGLRDEFYFKEAGSLEQWIEITQSVEQLAVIRPAIHRRLGHLLTLLPLSFTNVWNHYLKGSLPAKQLPVILKGLLQNMINSSNPDLLMWMLKNHFDHILQSPDHAAILNSSGEQVELSILELLRQIDGQLCDRTFAKNMQITRNALRLLGSAHPQYPIQVGIRVVELLAATEEPHLKLEISHLACRIFSALNTEADMDAVRDCQVLKEFLTNKDAAKRYPRLECILRKIILDGRPDLLDTTQNSIESCVATWCCEELNFLEGAAIARLLTTLSYSQIVTVFNKEDFNVGILTHCFKRLGSSLTKGEVTVDEVWDLFITEKRASQINKMPLGVATFDLVIDLLDRWENVVDKGVSAMLSNPNYDKQLCHVWKLLESMMRLKVLLVQVGGAVPQHCKNNFIPTKIFTFSFEVLKVKCLKAEGSFLQTVEDFFSFASLVLQDTSFMGFFNNREEQTPVITCIIALGTILRKVVKQCGAMIPFGCDESQWASCEEYRKVLMEYNYALETVISVQERVTNLEPRIYNSLRSVIAGLGRCDVINMLVLMSHLDWKPQSDDATVTASSVYHIPFEVFQNENSMLLQYVKKLHVLGVANKIQFEENWMLFLSVINSYGDENASLQIVCTGLRALSMILERTVRFTYVAKTPDTTVPGIDHVTNALESMEPTLCKNCKLPYPFSDTIRKTDNIHEVDFNSCIRFLIDLFSQWLQNPQGKMPLLLLSEVVQSTVRMAEYFEDVQQYQWMFETLIEIYKSFEKEDEILWPHLLYGVFYSGSKLPLEPDTVTYLVQILEGSLQSTYLSVSTAALQSGLVFLQQHPNTYPLINVISPYVLKNTHLAEIERDSEVHSSAVWKLLLFLWIHGPSDNIGVASFEQETLSNILTVLSPLNKVYVSIRLLALKSLQMKIMRKTLNWESKRSIAKIMYDTVKTKNISVFYEAIKLFATVFYTDFEELYHGTPEPEMLMQMAERTEVLFKLVRNGLKYNSVVVARLLPQIMTDFLPPSEILNRVIAEFLNPVQNSPELLAPLVTQLLEKARKKPKEAALVREWIVSSIPNFLSNPDFSRTSWSITIFFIGVSTTKEVMNLLPFAELRRTAWSQDLFILSALDFYNSLSEEQKTEFLTSLRNGPSTATGKNPYDFLVNILTRNSKDPKDTDEE